MNVRKLLDGAVAAIAKQFSPYEPQGSDNFEKLIDVVGKAADIYNPWKALDFLEGTLDRFGELREEALKFCGDCGLCCPPRCAARILVEERGMELVRCSIYNNEGTRLFSVPELSEREMKLGAAEIERRRRKMLEGRKRSKLCEDYSPARNLMFRMRDDVRLLDEKARERVSRCPRGLIAEGMRRELLAVAGNRLVATRPQQQRIVLRGF